MKEITRYFLEQSIGNYVILTTRDYGIYKGIMKSFINNSIILDNDVCIERSKIVSIDSIVIH